MGRMNTTYLTQWEWGQLSRFDWIYGIKNVLIKKGASVGSAVVGAGDKF